MFDIIFYIFGAITVAGAFITALAKNIVYAAFALLFTFFGIAGLYVMANADFLAVTQLLVYVGGILILLIFGVMLTSRIGTVDIRVSSGSKWVAGVLAIGLFAILSAAFFGSEATHTEKMPDGKSKTVSSWASNSNAPWSRSQWNKDATSEILAKKFGSPDEVKTKEGSSGTSVEIGKLFLTDFLLPFEVISVLILVSLIGATMIARKDPTPEEEAIAESVKYDLIKN
jgi:NADH:ubiquinone oxidoreductase subunit 6 (subunit J)